MKTAIVRFENGDTITTSINGTDSEIREYYSPGRLFNVGMGENDNMQKVKSLEILESVRE